jgi:CxxC motif-containing protein (DUF1111 family)
VNVRILPLAVATALAASVAAACSSAPRLAEGVFSDLGDIRPNATAEERAAFERGRKVAQHRFTPREGLGPEFNLTFCTGCHERPAIGGSGARYREFLLIGQRLPDGSYNPLGKSGVQTLYSLEPVSRVPTPDGVNVSATRVPIAFFGAGLLAEIPDEKILANADPDDRDGDGIRGRPNFDRGFVGRFGRKSQTVSLEGFIRGPLFNHLGITSNPLPDARKAKLPVPSAAAPAGNAQPSTRSVTGEGEEIGQVSQAQAAAPDEPTTDTDDAPDPELSEDDLFDLVSFVMLLGAPRPDPPTAESEAGRALFEKARCTACHVPALEGPRGLVPAYSDLLLHDMGPELADGVSMKLAGASDFRTQPLWGIAAEGPYLHDGRADTLDEAIRLHGGEAARSRDAYVALSDVERTQVLAFLRSLGGSAQQSEGLLPPGAKVPTAGEYGAPLPSLRAGELETWTRGRALFDRDLRIAAGLGPRFNGDSCRACHFDPVIGGAGPADVNVLRQGIFQGDVFVTPAMGTMAHLRATGHGVRPPIDPASNFFEPRQPPTILGLGLLERVPDADILALADPADADGDGVRGRPHVLADGRLGRFGWKAQIPSVIEFARDALSNESGITVPERPGETFGSTKDDDAVPDPEISSADLDALAAFMRGLAPPPRTRTDAAKEDRGEQIFGTLGCAACHVPALRTKDGVELRAYTDLLLHDVSAKGARGIADGDAKTTEFRTPPLWGLAKTAPYMHDGKSYSVEDAIARHDGEGAKSRDAFAALDAGARAAVLAFLSSL